jgi:dolichol-phosphate mannosyltransferase
MTETSAAEGAPPAVAAVIPCYREKDRVLDVIAGIGDEVSRIFVIDDACPDGTGAFVRDQCKDPRVSVLTHDGNKGVGGATMTGYEEAWKADCDIIVKVDGDGQMDPARIPDLIAPIVRGDADYAKGNRFHDLAGLSDMPTVRVGGNLFLSFASKLSSGYWDIFDPTNGFTAIHAGVAKALPFAKVSPGFFFESDLLFRLNLLRAVVADVPMEARYGGERSSLKIRNVVIEFLFKHARNTFKRLCYGYFLRDFNIASIELALGSVLLCFGVVFGALKWVESLATGIPTTAGTAMVAALPIIIGTQMLIAFLDFDTRNQPKTPLHPGL